jgi:hypothetical protein
MKIQLDGANLGELLRRLGTKAAVPLQPSGAGAASPAVQQVVVVKGPTLPVMGAPPGPAPNPGVAFVAGPKLQLLLDAAGAPDAPAALELANRLPPARAGAEPAPGAERNHADPRAQLEPQRITEAFWRTEVRPNTELQARRALESGFDEPAVIAPAAQQQGRTELGVPPGLQLLAALHAGAQGPSGAAMSRIAASLPDAAGKQSSRRKVEREAAPGSAAFGPQRSYLVAATVLAVLAALVLARSCAF